MTEKQKSRFYFPHWSACAKAHDWVMVKGRLPGTREERYGSDAVNDLYQRVWEAAGALAARRQRAITADDLRHGCHVVALGEDVPAIDLTNEQVDRVVSLFRVLADYEDLDALIELTHPENARRRRWVEGARRSAEAICRDEGKAEKYIWKICQDLGWPGFDWANELSEDQLRGLSRKLWGRLLKKREEWARTAHEAVEAPPQKMVRYERPF